MLLTQQGLVIQTHIDGHFFPLYGVAKLLNTVKSCNRSRHILVVNEGYLNFLLICVVVILILLAP